MNPNFTKEERFALALAVSDGKDRAQYLDLDAVSGMKISVGFDDVDLAARSDRSFMVRPRADLLVLDADTAQQSACLRRIAEQLREWSYAPVEVLSGGPGRMHLFCLIRCGPVHEYFVDKAMADGIDPRRTKDGLNNWIRPPGSPHPGGCGSAMTPSSASEAASALRGRAGQLSNAMSDLLVYGDRAGKYRSRSEVEMALYVSFLNAGLGFDDALTALLHPANVGGERAKELLAKKELAPTLERLHRSWLKAAEFVAANPPARRSDPELLGCHRRALQNPALTPTRRAAYEAIISKAEHHGEPFGLSVRELAEAANISKNTAHKTMKQLQSMNRLEEVSAGAPGRSTTWRLLQIEDTQSSHPPYEDGVSPICKELPPNHDAFSHGALNKSGLQILHALHAHGPIIRARIAEAAQLSPAAVTRNVKTLLEHGIVRESNEGTIHLTDLRPATLDAAAEELGTQGRLANRQRQFERERDQHARSLAPPPPPGIDPTTGEITDELEYRRHRALDEPVARFGLPGRRARQTPILALGTDPDAWAKERGLVAHESEEHRRYRECLRAARDSSLFAT